MINLTEVFLKSAPSRFKLGFGINKNVILKSISNEVRRDKNSVIINKNCYLTFASVEEDNKSEVLAESTFSYFNIDPSKPQYANKNFIHQFIQLMEIVKEVVPEKDFSTVVSDIQSVLNDNVSLFMDIKGSGIADSKLAKKIVILQEEVVNKFMEVMKPFVGAKSELVNLAVVCNSKGNFLDLPREDKGFISKMDGGRKLTIDSKYVRWFEDKDKKETAKSDDIGDDEVLEEDEILTGDDQLIDDM